MPTFRDMCCVRGFFLKLLFFVTLVAPLGAFADTSDAPDALPGWTHTPFARDTFQGHGRVVSGKTFSKISPVADDLDNDPLNGLEVVHVGEDGEVYAFMSDGTLYWQSRTPNARCQRQKKATDRVRSSPAIADLDGDGFKEVIVGFGAFNYKYKRCGGGVVAFNGQTGQRKSVFNLKKHTRKKKLGGLSYTVLSTVGIADVDGDGKKEIGFGAFNHFVYLLNYQLKPLWYYNAADTVWSSPAFANVDNDSQLEMIIGTDISENKLLKPPTDDGGYVYALDTQDVGEDDERQFRNSSSIVWQTYLPQTIMSSPVIADVLPEVEGDEVIVQSGCYFPDNEQLKEGRWIKVLNSKNGKVLATLDTPACASASVAVGDINDDGVNEIVAVVNGSKSVGGTGSSALIAFRADQVTPLWSITPRVAGSTDSFAGDLQSPIIADVDGNGSLEVLVASGAGIGIYEGSTGESLTCYDSVCSNGNETTLFTSTTVKATPLVADINNDGILDIVTGSSHTDVSGAGVIYIWTNLADVISSFPGSQPAFSAPWPMFKGNPART
ncbi:MAG: VCBS repeat-containing protein, partial [Bdellovibrionales bacterium]|nr:VCBS repeat-containing protein [Bdellovibrionales bacterium]